jgi:hypothetical protein
MFKEASGTPTQRKVIRAEANFAQAPVPQSRVSKEKASTAVSPIARSSKTRNGNGDVWKHAPNTIGIPISAVMIRAFNA